MQSGYPKNKITRLLNFIKLYINFEGKLSTRFDRQVERLTGKNKRTMGITEQILDIAEKRGLEKGERRGLLKGERRGLQKGEQRGETKTKTAIAKKMKLEGISQALIAKFTGLSPRQIRLL